jgi:tRNA(Ile)-lysidine synthase
MNSPESFDQRVVSAFPSDWRQVGVLLAVSGGPDSVALLRAAVPHAAGGPGARLVVAHFNHHLRGAESNADQEFVVRLCDALGVQCQVGRTRPGASITGADRAEAAARTVRYDFLQRTAEQLGVRYIATAHTADDQAETILHHILRGTGLAGLAGIRPVRPLGPNVTLLRPMLDIAREDVMAYLAGVEQPYRDDSSNRDPSFTRNRIRHELLPLLKRDHSPAIVESLMRLGTVAGDAQQIIERLAGEQLDRALKNSQPHGATIDCRSLTGQDRHLLRETMVSLWRRQGWPAGAMGFVEWDALAEMILDSETNATATSKRVLPGAIAAERRGDELVLARQP